MARREIVLEGCAAKLWTPISLVCALAAASSCAEPAAGRERTQGIVACIPPTTTAVDASSGGTRRRVVWSALP